MAKVDPKVKRAREEAERQRRTRRLNAVIAVLLVGILVESLYLLAQSKVLAVREIEVNGNRRVSADRVIALSGIRYDTNILTVSQRTVTGRLMREVWIESVRVSRRLPLKVEIQVKERQPIAVVAAGGRFLLVDASGRVLQVDKENVFPSLPLITDAGSWLGVDRGGALKSRALANALLCLDCLKPDLKQTVVTLSAPSIDGLSLQLRSGLVILYGKVEQPDEKNYAIGAISELAQSRGQALRYIDVRCPSNPAAMPQ